MKRIMKKSWTVVLTVVLMLAMVVPAAAKDSASCSDLYKAVKDTKAGGLKKMEKNDSCTFLSYSNRKKADDFAYASDSNQLYVVCIVKAGSTSAAKKMKTQFEDNKDDAVNSNYLTSSERKIAKTARYGRKGSYVWYLSLGSSSANKKAEKAIKKLL